MNNKTKNSPIFKPDLHKKYFYRMLGRLPSMLSTLDSNRTVLAYFAISGLDLLDELKNLPQGLKNAIIDWIYSLQVVDDNDLVSGFQGSSCFNTLLNKGDKGYYKWGHIASTYAALATLLALGDDLSRVNRDAIVKSLSALQLENGCFTSMRWGAESDMRFVYCATCICYILDDWRGINKDKLNDFIINSIGYDFGIAQVPEMESHSGSTFCAVAALFLTGRLDRLSPLQRNGLTRWLLRRVDGGFNGRPNKPIDTCYSFWTGGALSILEAYQFISSYEELRLMVLATQDKYGGFSKVFDSTPDPIHTYLGLAGLSLMGLDDLQEVFAPLNITERTHQHLKKLHSAWKQ